jgi:hypothetical protein
VNESHGEAPVCATCGGTRRRYIEALQEADSHDIGPLLAFARSSRALSQQHHITTIQHQHNTSVPLASPQR